MNQLRNHVHRASCDAQERPFAPDPVLVDCGDWMNASLLNALRAELMATRRCCVAADIAAAVIHEINQPLTAIVANAEACLSYLSAQPASLAKLKTVLQQIQRDVEDTSLIVRNLRALFRKENTEQAQVDIPLVIRDVLLRLDSQMNRYAIHTRLSIDAKIPPVTGDNLQLRQVLMNLIANAVESMQENAEWPRELKVTVCQEKTAVLTEIADRGHRLPDCENVFDACGTTKETGMGMGLRICRAIIEAHKGRIWARRRRDRGTIFTFSLPLAERTA